MKIGDRVKTPHGEGIIEKRHMRMLVVRVGNRLLYYWQKELEAMK